MLLYVAVPYSGDIRNNIAGARALAIELFKLGHTPITPHLNFANFESDMPDVPNSEYLKRDYRILDRCDGMVVMDDRKGSLGTVLEVQYCEKYGIPVWYAPNLPTLHLTEQRYPIQCRAFDRLLGSLSRIHLDKSADYGSACYLGTGELGLASRIWEKTNRLLNLMGFHIDVTKGSFHLPLNPKNEELGETYPDLAVLSLIGILIRDGKWGR